MQQIVCDCHYLSCPLMSTQAYSYCICFALLCFVFRMRSVSFLLLLLLVVRCRKCYNAIICTKKRGMFCHSLLPSFDQLLFILQLSKVYHHHHPFVKATSRTSSWIRAKALPSLLLKAKVHPLTQNILPHKGLSFMKAFFHITTFTEHK